MAGSTGRAKWRTGSASSSGRFSIRRMSSVAERKRCAWPGTDPLFVAYHDEEWGVPLDDDRVLFEFLILEGAQAGLSWSSILRKQHPYLRAFSVLYPQS